MENIPEKIYLQIGEDADVTIDNSITDFNELFTSAITWSTDKINDNDIEYVRGQDANLKNAALPIFSVSGSALLPIKQNDPMPWEDGEWDGLRSDLVAVLTDRDEWHIGRRYSGYMDGADFDDWYTPDDYEIRGKVVGWVKLPR
jgi:hypothetical protein